MTPESRRAGAICCGGFAEESRAACQQNAEQNGAPPRWAVAPALAVDRVRETDHQPTTRTVSKGERNGQKQWDPDEHEDAPDRVTRGVGGCAPATAREREGVDPRSRCYGRAAAADAVAGR